MIDEISAVTRRLMETQGHLPSVLLSMIKTFDFGGSCSRPASTTCVQGKTVFTASIFFRIRSIERRERHAGLPRLLNSRNEFFTRKF